MTDLVISGELAARLSNIAAREHRPVTSVIETMIKQYNASPQESLPPLPTLGEILAEMDPRQQAMYREFRKKLYAIAREYWQREGNQERLALTDEQLDDQFWLIDPDDIPRLKSEYGTITLPHDPIDDIDGFFADSELTDMSTTTRETLDEYYRTKYGRPD
ncbi:MAG: hypothetical protein ACYDBJ_21955 [Aggregatilineales bacterium]